MDSLEITENTRVMPDKEFDLSVYAKSVFSMFGGEETSVSIELENELVGVIFDKFGADVPVVKSDENHFICKVKVAVSPHFLTWIMSFGNRAKIISPDNVIEEMKKLSKEIFEIYK